MNATLQMIMPALATLDSVDRSIVRHYLDELDEKENGELLENEDDPDFVAEINRRVESIRDGTAKMVPGDEVMNRLREKFG